MSGFIRPPGPVGGGLKIGLLGGSFNPAHEGHRYVSEVALKRLGLDYVWWLVSPQNPLKPTIGMAPLSDRLVHARRCARNPRIVTMDIEKTLGTRYTIDTVTALQRRFGDTRFVWLMGSDNLESFHRWRRWQEIARRIPIAVVLRPGAALPARAKAMQRLARAWIKSPGRIATAEPPAIAVVDGHRCFASATAIRARAGWSEALVGAIPPC